MFKIETHMHTKHVSACAKLDAATLAEGYQKAGYAAVVVTDHYNRDTFHYLHIDTAAHGDIMSAFLDGFHRMEEECAKRSMVVYQGAELRFDECYNDYLLYNYPDDLLAEPEEIFRMGIAAFAPLARKVGALLIQAHPYRTGCTPVIASYLDGVEVLNLNPHHYHHSYNDRAQEYAARFQLLRTGGSDCHSLNEIGLGGLLSPTLPEDSAALVRLIRSGEYTIIGEE